MQILSRPPRKCEYSLYCTGATDAPGGERKANMHHFHHSPSFLLPLMSFFPPSTFGEGLRWVSFLFLTSFGRKKIIALLHSLYGRNRTYHSTKHIGTAQSADTHVVYTYFFALTAFDLNSSEPCWRRKKKLSLNTQPKKKFSRSKVPNHSRTTSFLSFPFFLDLPLFPPHVSSPSSFLSPSSSFSSSSSSPSYFFFLPLLANS